MFIKQHAQHQRTPTWRPRLLLAAHLILSRHFSFPCFLTCFFPSPFPLLGLQSDQAHRLRQGSKRSALATPPLPPPRRSKGSAPATLSMLPPRQGSEGRAVFALSTLPPRRPSSPLARSPGPPRNVVTPVVMRPMIFTNNQLGWGA